MEDTVEKAAMRKIYLRLLPFAFICYSLCYIDRINVSFAGLTMRGDLDLTATAFGFAAGAFYWGYFIFEVPSNIIMEKVGARLWIARIMITWGILAGLTAVVTGPVTFTIVTNASNPQRVVLDRVTGDANDAKEGLYPEVVRNLKFSTNHCDRTGYDVGSDGTGPWTE